MPIMFNMLLREAEFPLCDVRLVRHQDTRADKGCTPYDLWRYDREAFERYQETQAIRNKAKLDAPYWAVFVGTPDGGTMFVGIYCAQFRGELEEDRPAPHIKGETEKAGTLHVYDLTLRKARAALGDLIGKLFIDWGEGRGKGRGGEKAWVQYPEDHDKPIKELRAEPVRRAGRPRRALRRGNVS
jgi:hypothetical protein